MPEDRWMHGKAAGSPEYWRYVGDRGRSQCVLAGSRGNLEERATIPWGAHQGNRIDAKRLR
jgi:hypothetical protein